MLLFMKRVATLERLYLIAKETIFIKSSVECYIVHNVNFINKPFICQIGLESQHYNDLLTL